MRRKYDKYWGNYKTMNILLFVVVLLDPGHKDRFLKYCFDILYGEQVSKDVVAFVKDILHNLYACYSTMCDGSYA